MSKAPALVWFRQDLRLADHPALRAAAAGGGPVVAVYIWAPEEEGAWPPGGAARWWIHHALAALDADLRAKGNRLLLRRGPTLETLRALLRETGARSVFWNRRYEPAAIARDTALKQALRAEGIEARSFNGSALFEPGSVRTQQDAPFQVFTPFYKACLRQPEPPEPLPVPVRLPAPASTPPSLSLDDLDLLPRIPWDRGFPAAWKPGRAGAEAALAAFLDRALRAYPEARNLPSEAGSSRLSPYLHHGELSPREIWHAVKRRLAEVDGPGWVAGAECYLREVVWREFALQLLLHFPHTPEQPLREAYARFPWRDDPPALRAWQRGRTGYPLVDAGMRELWTTGWMHNRVRMITASFLVKHLLLPWSRGAAWFWDTLVDADLANNTLGWQWTAGCGADAAPYFRIFNPITQGDKFSAHAYVRRHLPALAGLPDAYLFRPWEAPPETLRAAGVALGETYPRPWVEHGAARDRALEALSALTAGIP
jgi:deoxyribodipyrimidine photo-lyase